MKATTSDVEAFRVVIPARYASRRLPGKPLRMLGSKPLIHHVYENACRSGAEQVVVTTEDPRVAACVRDIGGVVRMTPADCISGSDRIASAVDLMQWPDDVIVVNLQGDEPFLPPQAIATVAAALARHPAASIATLAAPLGADTEDDEGVVKVMVGDDGFALQFSRSPVKSADNWQHHFGIYAYRCAYLRCFARLPVPEVERREKLEQLRALHRGDAVYVQKTRFKAMPGIDTREDLNEAVKLLDTRAAASG